MCLILSTKLGDIMIRSDDRGKHLKYNQLFTDALKVQLHHRLGLLQD